MLQANGVVHAIRPQTGQSSGAPRKQTRILQTNVGHAIRIHTLYEPNQKYYKRMLQCMQ